MELHAVKPADLKKWIRETTTSSESRSSKAQFVMDHPHLVDAIFALAFGQDRDLAYKSLLILEAVARLKPVYVLSDYVRYTDQLGNITHHSAIRPLVKITESLLLERFIVKDPVYISAFSEVSLKQISEQCFTWFLGAYKPAAKAFAMQCLYLLGLHYAWIHPELKSILEKQYASESKAYQARARHILSQLA